MGGHHYDSFNSRYRNRPQFMVPVALRRRIHGWSLDWCRDDQGDLRRHHRPHLQRQDGE